MTQWFKNTWTSVFLGAIGLGVFEFLGGPSHEPILRSFVQDCLIAISVLIVIFGVYNLWSRSHAGVVLLDLGRAARWKVDCYWAIFWLGVSLLQHDSLGLAFFSTSNAILSLMHALGRLQVRERGLVMASLGYLPWTSIISYTVTDRDLTVQYCSLLGFTRTEWAVTRPFSPTRRDEVIQVLGQRVAFH